MVTDNDDTHPPASGQVFVCLGQHSLLLIVPSGEVGFQEVNTMYGPECKLDVACPYSNSMIRLRAC
jgi:hypothetical protein